MTFFHFYAAPEFKEFEDAQGNELELTTSQLTKEMVLALISKHATGKPPYQITVPRYTMYEAHGWNIPETLLTIVPIIERENDVSPIGRGDLVFPGTGICVFIHARRAVPCSFYGDTQCERVTR